MFSGIVEKMGLVAAVRGGAAASRLVIEAGDLFDDLALGASVAVNGVCLTLAGRGGSRGEFDVIPETLRRTNLGGLQAGDRVNLERSLRVGDRIDGHLVQGHVDGAGRVLRVAQRGGEWKLWVEVDAGQLPFIVPKGSVTLDGVSLTLVDVVESSFSVALIPTTLERTTLGARRGGDAVNVETDILARVAVQRIDALLGARAGAARVAASQIAREGLTWARLEAAGFAP